MPARLAVNMRRTAASQSRATIFRLEAALTRMGSPKATVASIAPSFRKRLRWGPSVTLPGQAQSGLSVAAKQLPEGLPVPRLRFLHHRRVALYHGLPTGFYI